MGTKISPNLKPIFVIFLDIDGVVYNRPDEGGVIKKVKELFPNYEGCYTNRICSIAAAYFFDKKALQNLDILISKIEEVAQVQIVISSEWRKNRTIEELKTTFFGIHNFSKYIVDKTTENLLEKEVKHYCSNASHTSICRAAEIQHWLKNHPKVTNYVVFDDNDRHLSHTFGKRFIKINYSTLLTSELVLEALKLVQEQVKTKTIKRSQIMKFPCLIQ